MSYTVGELQYEAMVKVTHAPLSVGDCPHWDARTQSLYFVSIRDRTLHRYCPATGEHAVTIVAGHPGFIIPLENYPDYFVLGLHRSFMIARWDGRHGSPVHLVSELAEVDISSPRNYIYGGKTDPKGRLYAGTMVPVDCPQTVRVQGKGPFERLYMLNEVGIRRFTYKIGFSKGMAWDPDSKKMYHMDPCCKTIQKCDYNTDEECIKDPYPVFKFERYKFEGYPAGLTIDRRGNLWVAMAYGGRVLHISPYGNLLGFISIPAKVVTSCTFGGPNLDILFVTTARDEGYAPNGEVNPDSGHTFMITGLGAKGYAGADFRMYKKNRYFSILHPKDTEEKEAMEAGYWEASCTPRLTRDTELKSR